MYESAGMHASLLGFCLESLLIDNDMLGSINRNVRGIEVNDATLSFDVISESVLVGPGHYLGSDQTLSMMQSEFASLVHCPRAHRADQCGVRYIRSASSKASGRCPDSAQDDEAHFRDYIE